MQYVIAGDHVIAAHETGQDLSGLYPNAQAIVKGNLGLGESALALPLDTLKTGRKKLIDMRTDELLAQGVEHREVRFPLDTDHKTDYQIVLMTADSLAYPYTVIGADGAELELEDKDELLAWFAAGVLYGQSLIDEGAAARKAIDALETAREVLDWQDERD